MLGLLQLRLSYFPFFILVVVFYMVDTTSHALWVGKEMRLAPLTAHQTPQRVTNRQRRTPLSLQAEGRPQGY